MNSGTFDYNGVNSSKFGVLVQKRPDRVTSTHNFYSADPSAADNPSLRDKKTYTKTSIKLMCWFKSPDTIEEYNQKLTDIVDWLDLGRDDVSFTPWYDPSHTYKCSVSGGLTFVNFDDGHRAITFDLTLQLDAWKYLNSGMTQGEYVTDQEYTMGYGIPDTVWQDGYAYLKLPTTIISDGEIVPLDSSHYFTLIKGTTYTQTIWFETDANVKDLSAAQITWYTNGAGHDIQQAIVQKLGQNSYKIVSTYTWPGKTDSNEVRLFDIEHLASAFDLSTGTYLKFGKLKLEKGSLSTDLSNLSQTVYCLTGTSFTLTNPTKNTALPMSLVLTGTGDATITINQRVLTVKGVQGSTTINSINKTHSGGIMVGLDYPYLDPGLNTITTTGSTAVSLTPYWREKVV